MIDDIVSAVNRWFHNCEFIRRKPFPLAKVLIDTAGFGDPFMYDPSQSIYSSVGGSVLPGVRTLFGTMTIIKCIADERSHFTSG
jgi:hypothetical protein